MSLKVFFTILVMGISGICFAQELTEEQLEEKEFLAANKSNKEVKSLSSGLQYKIINKGKGRKPTAADEVYVRYIGRFVDGTIFDQSVAQVAAFKMTGIIPGMSEGLSLIGKGGKMIMYIPSSLAYGARGTGNIPPYKLLIFEVELVDLYDEEKD